MGKPLELKGKRFGRLRVIRRTTVSNVPCRTWECLCDCGITIVARAPNLQSGNTTSCGCSHRIHGHSPRGHHSSEYHLWRKIITVCNYSKDAQYHNFGGKGIKVCKKWHASFSAFLKDMGHKPTDCTLARINESKDFKPGNCFWKKRVSKLTLRPFETMFLRLKRTATKHAPSFGLTYEDFVAFTKVDRCHYCEWPIRWVNNARAAYNLDRKNNQIGYTTENCVVCCIDCNQIKGARFSYEEMLMVGPTLKTIREKRRKNEIDLR